MKRRIISIVSLAAVLAATSVGAMTVTRQLSLDDTVRSADRIVHATVTSIRTGKDASGLAATWVTFDVEKAVKGDGGRRLTIKQFGNSDASSTTPIGRIPDLPTYSVGEELVVFLRRDSGRGFTSPVGLEGGVYRVRAEHGRRIANRSMDRSAVDLEALLADISERVARQRTP